jgi:hypothetical protein
MMIVVLLVGVVGNASPRRPCSAGRWRRWQTARLDVHGVDRASWKPGSRQHGGTTELIWNQPPRGPRGRPVGSASMKVRNRVRLDDPGRVFGRDGGGLHRTER